MTAKGDTGLLALRRVALLLEYDGTRYHGMQRQTETDLTIQGEVERVAATVGSHDFQFACAGRTDAGVHATGQVVTVHLPERLEERRIAKAMNALLPPDIRVRRAVVCSPEFHPRFDAISRTYLYRFCAAEPVPPIYRNFVAPVVYTLDQDLTIAAASAFEGQWELKEWRSSMCQATRTFLHIDEVSAAPPAGERPWWQVQVRARSFLHNQVRFMIGGIVAVGSGRLSLHELKEALANGKRPIIVKKEAACGLCLIHVGYSPETDPFVPKPDR